MPISPLPSPTAAPSPNWSRPTPASPRHRAVFCRRWKRGGQKNLPLVEALAPKNGQKGNVYELRRLLLATIADTFAGSRSLLTDHQIRGAFARYVDDLKADLKSIAASGWGPELIPDDDILESQFPEVLADMEQKRLRLAELQLSSPPPMKRIMKTATTPACCPRRGQDAQGRTQRSQCPGQAGEDGRTGMRRLSCPRPRQSKHDSPATRRWKTRPSS